MSIDKNKNLVGQPIFKQLINLIPKHKFMALVFQLQANRYYKTFYAWDHFITMLYGIYSRCDSMGEVCDSMRALGGKLNHLGMEIAPAKSTFGDALRERNNELFRSFFFVLLEHFEPDLSVSRKKRYSKADISIKNLYALDSSTISLFSDIMKGVSRTTDGDGKKKGGLKVHMVTDIHADTPVFAYITDAKTNDQKFLGHFKIPVGSMVVFDKGYNNYKYFAQLTKEGVYFVTRLKNDASYQVIGEAMFKKELNEGEFGVFKVEHIQLQYDDPTPYKIEGINEATFTGKKMTLNLRLVHYRDEKGRYYKFITNNWDITADEVALIYKYRWTIETTFKKLKQNFQLT